MRPILPLVVLILAGCIDGGERSSTTTRGAAEIHELAWIEGPMTVEYAGRGAIIEDDVFVATDANSYFYATIEPPPELGSSETCTLAGDEQGSFALIGVEQDRCVLVAYPGVACRYNHACEDVTGERAPFALPPRRPTPGANDGGELVVTTFYEWRWRPEVARTYLEGRGFTVSRADVTGLEAANATVTVSTDVDINGSFRVVVSRADVQADTTESHRAELEEFRQAFDDALDISPTNPPYWNR